MAVSDVQVPPDSHATGFNRRSSSISPSQSPSGNRPLKRKRTRDFFNALNPSPGETDGGQMPHARRRSSIFNFFSFSKTTSKGEGYQEVRDPDHNSNNNNVQERSTGKSPIEESAVVDDDIHPFHCDSVPQDGPSSRRPSRLGSWGSRFKSFFEVTRRRKDSSMADTSLPNSPTSDNPHPMEEVLHNTAYVESLALQGALRFAHHSTDVMESIDGPSDYWRAERYQNRQCVDARTSPFCEHPPQERELQDWYPRHLSTPTANTITEAGMADNPDRWHRLRPWNPSLMLSRNRYRQYSRVRLGSLGLFGRKPSNVRGKRAMMSTHGSRHSSCARSIASKVSFINNPNPFGPTPNLNFSISMGELGVLPATDSESIDNTRDVPKAIYTSSVASSLQPLVAAPKDSAQTRSSSVVGIHPASVYPPSPILRPAIEPSPPGALDSHPSLTPPPIKSVQPSSACSSTGPLDSSSEALAVQLHHHPLPPPEPQTNSAGTSNTDFTICTAMDDSSELESLRLRRASSLTNVTKEHKVDGDGHVDRYSGEEERRVVCCE